MASHIFVKDISPESLAARDGNIQEGDVVLKVREHFGLRGRPGFKNRGAQNTVRRSQEVERLSKQITVSVSLTEVVRSREESR